jgi:hypothetical protein
MFSNRFKGNLASVVGTLLLSTMAATSLVGCKNTSRAGAAEPDQVMAERLVAAKITPLPLGKPFLLNGCMVQMYRVAVETPGFSLAAPMDVTMSTADCPSAKVTATNQKCGKTCVTDTLKIEPKAPAAIEGPAPAATPEPAPAAAQ